MNKNTTGMVTETSAANFRFTLGVLAGTVIGAGLVMWLSPRTVAESRRTVIDAAADLRDRAAEQFGQAGRRVSAVIDDLSAKGYGLRDDAADAVAHGAHEVERVAVAVKAMPPRQS
jgi:gas vesicle protein